MNNMVHRTIYHTSNYVVIMVIILTAIITSGLQFPLLLCTPNPYVVLHINCVCKQECLFVIFLNMLVPPNGLLPLGQFVKLSIFTNIG